MQSSSSPACPLLSLPTELRTLIYDFFLLTAPPLSTTTPTRQYPADPGHPNQIFCSASPAHTYNLPLLLTCRSIFTELSTAITRLRARGGLIYTLDCFLRPTEERTGIFTTWTRVPAPLRSLQHLELPVRVDQSYHDRNDEGIAVFPDVMVTLLIKTLALLLLHGPRLAHERRVSPSIPLLESVTFVDAGLGQAGDWVVKRISTILRGFARAGLLGGRVGCLRWRAGAAGGEDWVVDMDADGQERFILEKSRAEREMDWASWGWVLGYKHDWKLEAEACCDGLGWQTS